MSNAIPVFVGYVRVSTEEQALSGLSLEQQEQRLRAFAAAQGGELLRVYADPGVSGSVPPAKRPGLSRLLADLNKLTASKPTLVVYRLDRLGRNAREVLTLEHQLSQRRSRLASVTEQFDSGTPSGRAYLGLLSVFSEYELGLIRERTFVAMRGAVQRDSVRVGAPPPLGYETNVSGVFHVIASEADLVRQLFALFVALRSFASVARTLNDAGSLPPSGRYWSHTTVADVLRKGPTYAGSRVWGRSSRRAGPRDPASWVVLRDAHTPIIDADTATEVAALLDRRVSRRTARRGAAQLAQVQL